MRVELPSGSWVEIREKLTAGDKFSVQSSFSITSDQEGQQHTPSGLVNMMRNALLERIITGWGGGDLEGIPIPSVNVAGAAVMDSWAIEDYDALAEVADPLLEKIVKPGPKQKTPPSS